MFSERLDVRVEVYDSHVLLVFPKRIDDHMTPWQEAYILGEVMEMAASDIINPGIINPLEVEIQKDQIKLQTYKDKYVVMLFEHTDRIQLCKEACILVAREIKKKAQDLEYLNKKKIRFVYRKDGLLKRIINSRLGYTQEVRK